MIRLTFSAADLLHVRFAISPAEEILGAVRTVAQPSRHAYHLPWLRRLRGDELADLSELVTLACAHGTPDFLSPPPTSPLVDLDDQLRRLRTAAPAVVEEELAFALGGRRPRSLTDPRAAATRLGDQMAHAWELLLAPVWDEISALLEADVIARARHLAGGGIAEVFKALHPRVRWVEPALEIEDDDWREDIDLAGGGLLLIPSVFTWPDVQVMIAPWPTSLIYPAPGIGGLWEPPRGDPAIGKAFGRTRGMLLAELVDPATTSALARRHGVAPSTVSAHLTALRDAGLVTTQRDGREVLYRLSPIGYALLHRR